MLTTDYYENLTQDSILKINISKKVDLIPSFFYSKRKPAALKF